MNIGGGIFGRMDISKDFTVPQLLGSLDMCAALRHGTYEHKSLHIRELAQIIFK
jgi:hypothetical protein